MLTTIAA